jgi:hypothetical protein
VFAGLWLRSGVRDAGSRKLMPLRPNWRFQQAVENLIRNRLKQPGVAAKKSAAGLFRNAANYGVERETSSAWFGMRRCRDDGRGVSCDNYL